MELLNNILARFAHDFGLEGALSDEELRLLVYRHIDSDLSPYVRGVWLEENILVIQCTEPVAIQEFQSRVDGLKLRINRDAGRAALASIKLVLYSSRKRR
jgi:hypothetical protein